MFHVKHLQTVFEQARLPAPAGFLEGATAHLNEVYRWNQRFDLTSVPESVAPERHTLDSILPFAAVPAPPTLLDIGSGAGFPGVPLALWWPRTQVTLLEPLRKRRSFLESCCAKLRIECTIRSEAAETLRGETWSMVTSRATLPWATLISVALGLLAPGGSLLALIGPEQAPRPGELREILDREPGWSTLETRPYALPSGANRLLLVGRVAPAAPALPPAH